MKRNLKLLLDVVDKNEKLLKEMDDTIAKLNEPDENDLSVHDLHAKRLKMKHRVEEYRQSVTFLQNKLEKVMQEIKDKSSSV